MKLPNNTPLLLHVFVAGFSVLGVSSLVLAAVYFARLDEDLWAVVAAAVLFGIAGCVIVLGSLSAILVAGARSLRSVFGRRFLSS
ncbi:hypothetical protein G6L37_03305 [Agrobacterium rubi]|nr:hypothetical protein [Agrobacterium rubi]NTF24403.1 hypothetical protein [Agrobacterium rubi]